MSHVVASTVSSPHWASLIAYLCIYFSCLIAVTIIGFALYHTKPKINRETYPPADHTSTVHGTNNISNEDTSQTKQTKSIICSKYFLLIKQRSWILLSLSIHIIIQSLNFSVMIELISLSKYNMYSFDPNTISHSHLTELCIISLLSFILYRFGSAILIWKLSHSVRKSTFQIIDITILYQLLKGYKERTRNNPGRIVEYITYLNAMFLCWIQAIVQLVFLMKTQILRDARACRSYAFIYIILMAFVLNIYGVIQAIYNKDLLLSSESYRRSKSMKQIATHVFFRFIDVSLRVIILSMLWITLGFIGVVLIVGLELLIIAYLAHFTSQSQRLQEMVAVILHITHIADSTDSIESDEEEQGRSRPVTPATIRMTNELQVQLNVDIEEMEKQELEHKREMMRECACFKWRMITNIVYIAVFALFCELQVLGSAAVNIDRLWCICVSGYCIICATLYPFLYFELKNSTRWRRMSVFEDDIFGYLQGNDFESAQEILDFGKRIDISSWIEWSSQWDFSAHNNPNLLIKFLYSQNVNLSSIVHKSQGGLNILHQICKNPELSNASSTIQLLIQYGVDIAANTHKTEDTPLHIACCYCNESVMFALLDNGNQHLFVKNRWNQTPLHSLMIGYHAKYEENQISMTSTLFKTYNAQQCVSDLDIHGQSALHIACLNKQCPVEIIRLLLVNGAYPNQTDNDGFYPNDHVLKWDKKERKNDIELVLKWLNKGVNDRNNKKKKNTLLTYIQLSKHTVDIDAHEEHNIEDDDDDDDDDDNGIDPHNMITPLDPSPIVGFDDRFAGL